MSEITVNYESLIRKTRGTTSGGEKRIRFVCLVCEQDVTDERPNRCVHCGGAVEAIYDLAAVSLPKSRTSPNTLEHFFPLLPLRRRESLRWGGEGNTPCFEVPALSEAVGVGRVFLKDESVNPTRSTKDRISSVGLSRFGELGVRDMVLSSTGNSSTAYARAAQLMEDVSVHIFVGRDFVHRLNYPPHPRVTTHVVDGEFVAAGKVGEKFANENGYFWEGGFFNLSRREGLKVAYLEAYDQMPVEPQYVFQAISSGMGLLGGFKGAVEYRELGLMERVPSMVAVQQESCSPMAHAFEEDAEAIAPHHIVANPKGLAHAILRGNPTGTYPYIRDMCLQTGGRILAAEEDRIQRARQLLADHAGVDVCFASSTALAGAMRMAEEGQLDQDSVVLVQLTGADRPAVQNPTPDQTWTA